MGVDTVTVISWIIAAAEMLCTLVVAVIAYFLKRELNRVARLEERQRKFELKVAGEYVPKADFHRSNSEIMNKLDKIQDLILDIVKKED